MIKNKRNKYIAVSSFVLLLLVALSCKLGLGLGDVVDVEAPVVVISSPSDSSIVNGEITVSGTYTDDIGVTKVTVEVHDINNLDKAIYSAEASMDGEATKGTWSLTFDSTEFNDGTYRISVYAQDSTYTSVKMPCVIDIDNTAPLFFIKNPNSVDINSTADYGSSISVVGEISDNHKVESMKITVYDQNKNVIPIYHDTFTGFTTAGGTEVIIARNYSVEPGDTNSIEYAQYRNYLDIYDMATKGVQYFYLEVSVTDIAGNSSDKTYLSSALNSVIYSQTNMDSSMYTVDDLKSILADSYTGSSLDKIQVDTIKNILLGQDLYSDVKKTYISNIDNPLAISVDVEACPTFEVLGFNLQQNTDGAVDSWAETNSGSSISIKVAAGRDETYVKPSTLEVTLYQVNASGHKGANAKQEQIEKRYITNSQGKTVSLITNSVSMGTYLVTLPSLESNQYYLIEVDGEDENGAKLKASNDTLYGFMVARSGKPPVVMYDNENTPSNESDLNDVSFGMAGTVRTATPLQLRQYESIYEYPYWEVSALNESTNQMITWSDYIKITDQKMTKDVNAAINKETDFTWSVSEDDMFDTSKCPAEFIEGLNNGDNFTLYLSATFSNYGGETTSSQRVIHIDKQMPVANISSVTPIVQDDTLNMECINGYVTLKTDASDAKLNSVELKASYIDASNNAAVNRLNLKGSNYSSSAEFNTLNVKDDTDVIFIFTATDKAGNKTESRKTYRVKQSTDAPIIKANNAKENITTITTTDNLFNTDGALVINISDDDGVGVIKAKISEHNKNVWSEPVVIGNTETISISLSDIAGGNIAQGEYDIMIIAEDCLKDTPEKTTQFNTSSKTYYIGVDNGCPDFTISTISNAYFKKGSTSQVVVEGTADDKSLFIDFSIDGGNTWLNIQQNAENQNLFEYTSADNKHYFVFDVTNKDECKWKYTIKNPVASGTINFVARDKYNQKTNIKPFVYNIDGTPPEFVDLENNDSTYTNKSSLKLQVHIKDPTDDKGKASGINTVTYVIKQNNTVVSEGRFEPDNDYVYGDPKNNCYNYSTMFGLVEGESTLVITVTDKVGNSSSVDYIYKVDYTPPLITEPTIKGNPTKKINNANKDNTYIQCKITEVGSGLSNITLYKGSETLATQSFDEEKDFYEIKIPANKFIDGENTFSITAKDVCGNVSSYSYIIVTCDTTPPVVKVLSPTSNSIVDKKIQLSGTYIDSVSDASGTKIQIFDIVQEKWIDCTGIEIESDSSGNWNTKDTTPINTEDFVASTYGTTIYLRAVFSDSLNNANNFNKEDYLNDNTVVYDPRTASLNGVVKYRVDQNNDRPIITVSSVLLDGTSTLKNTVEVTGKVIDYDEGEDIQLYYITKEDYEAYYTAKNMYPTEPSHGGIYDSTHTSNIWHEIEVDTDGSWVATHTKDDGATTWYFYVIDPVGTSFFTKDKTEASGVYLKHPYIEGKLNKGDRTKTKKDDTDGISFHVDTKQPVFAEQKVYITSSSTDVPAVNSDKWVDPAVASNLYAGGTNKYMFILLKATDANGIASITSNGISQYDSISTNTSMTVRLGPLDISTFETGATDFVFKAEDKSGLSITSNRTVNIDNQAPVVEATYPSATDYVSSALNARGTVSDNTGGCGLKKIYWTIPTNTKIQNGLQAPVAATISSVDITKWHALNAASTWTIDFAFNGQDTTSPLNLQNYVDSNDYGTITGSGIKEIPVYFYVEDEIGNSKIDKFVIINTDPDSGIPKSNVVYPTDNLSAGGTIHAYGNATDNGVVTKVYVQLDVNGDGEFNDTDKNIVKQWSQNAANTSYYNMFTEAGVQPGNDAAKATWGILAEGSSNWSIVLNKNKELSDLNSSRFHIRSIAYDDESHFGKDWSQKIEFKIDQDIPSLSTPYLKQYSDSTFTTETASQLYSRDIWLKGTWYLEMDLVDDNGISQIYIENVVGSSSTLESFSPNLASNGNYRIEDPTPIPGSDYHNYHIRIPLSDQYDDASGNINAKLYVVDGVADTQKHSATFEFSVNIDNTSPSVYDNANSYSNSTLAGNLGLRSGGFDTDSVFISDTNYITQTNYTYTVGGRVDEKGSGFDKVVMYYKRKIDDITSVYDVMLKQNNKVIVESNPAVNTVYINGDGLPVIKYEGLTRSDESTVTLAEQNSHIHVGGLVKIGGVYRTITSYKNNILTFTPSVDKSYTDAEFVYAQVIDHITVESQGSTLKDNGYYNVINDDGDGMVESVERVGSTYTWSATINSKNIEDGPIEIHTITFDKAGNITHGYVSTTVQNNRPRITKVFIGTDLDNSGKFDYKTYNQDDMSLGEFNYYSGSDDINGSDKVSLDSKDFKVKNKLAIVPEFVSSINGNNLKYVVSAYDNTSNAAARLDTAEQGVDSTGTNIKGDNYRAMTLDSANLITNDTSYISGNKYYMVPSSAGYVSFTNNELYALCQQAKNSFDASNDSVLLTLSFWDNTPGLKQGYNSQSAVLNVPLTIAINDKVAPTSVIHKFFYNSKDDNSLYQNSSNNGHIELENDLSEKLKQALGDDPKVSGKIVIRGTSYDNQELKEIYLTVPGHSVLDTRTKVASFASGVWTINNTPAMDTDKYEFAIEEEILSQSGHTVKWALSIDTEAIIGLAVQNVIVVSEAVDHDSLITGVAEITGNLASAIAADSQYQMDVVPYITNVTTELSKLNKNNPSIYNRTAQGHYPVRVTGNGNDIEQGTGDETKDKKLFEYIEITGFNLGSDKIVVKSKDLTTGKYTVTVNEIDSINNINNDNAKGNFSGTISNSSSYDDLITHGYNRKPNNQNNNRLTDDVYFDVWQFNSQAGTSISGKIEQAVMKINPETDIVGFAFANGSQFFSMGDKEYSYQYWMGDYDFFSSIGFTYDKLGNSYGTTAGGDINPEYYDADKFKLLSSRWGTSGKGSGGSYGNTNSYRLESIGQVEVKQNDTSTSKDFEAFNYDKQRIKSPTMATAVHGSNTNLYLAYYDGMNNEVRFKAGTIGSNTSIEYWDIEPVTYLDTSNEYAHIPFPDSTYFKNNTEFYICDKYGNDLYDDDGNKINPGPYKAAGVGINNDRDLYFKINGQNKFPYVGGTYCTSGTNYGTKPVEEFKTYIKFKRTTKMGNFVDSEYANDPVAVRHSYCSLIAGGATGNGAGDYVSLGVVSSQGATVDDVVVVVWYDSEERKLKYSYNTTAYTPLFNDQKATQWSTPLDVFTGDMANAGEYCQLTVDINGGVHIAAYDPVNLDLVYAYLPSAKKGKATSTNDFKTCIVDGYGVVGINLTIDTAVEDGKVIPFISYYDNFSVRPKYARLTKEATLGAAGTDSDNMYTGNWEIAVVPTKSNIEMQSSQHNYINIGVWKDKDTHAIKDSPSTTSECKNTAAAYNSVSWAKIYGNGSANPILGYIVKKNASNDTIETAQIRKPSE